MMMFLCFALNYKLIFLLKKAFVLWQSGAHYLILLAKSHQLFMWPQYNNLICALGQPYITQKKVNYGAIRGESVPHKTAHFMPYLIHCARDKKLVRSRFCAHAVKRGAPA